VWWNRHSGWQYDPRLKGADKAPAGASTEVQASGPFMELPTHGLKEAEYRSWVAHGNQFGSIRTVPRSLAQTGLVEQHSSAWLSRDIHVSFISCLTHGTLTLSSRCSVRRNFLQNMQKTCRSLLLEPHGLDEGSHTLFPQLEHHLGKGKRIL
jgi:hypothetical protein